MNIAQRQRTVHFSVSEAAGSTRLVRDSCYSAPLLTHPRGAVEMAEGGRGPDVPLPEGCQNGETAESEDETEVRGINIDSFPDEVMINIFSSISFKDLVHNVQNVCVRWRRLARDPVLWLDKEYIVRGRCRQLKQTYCCGVVASKCIRCRCVLTDEAVLRTANTMPQLRRLKLMRSVEAPVLREICKNCPNLTNLRIDGAQERDDSLMKYIFEKCPKIRQLSMGSSLLADRRSVEIVSSLKHLRSLEMYIDNWCKEPVNLSALAETCPELEEISLEWPYFKVEDMEYFLKAKKHSLTSVTLRWMWVRTWCVVPQLKQCHTLRKLELSHFDDTKPGIDAAAFEALGELHSLRELSILHACPHPPEVLSLAFRPGCLTQLQRLKLETPEMRDETVIAISRNCPNLCELRLRSCSITDLALSEIHNLKHLKILDLSECSGLRGAAVEHIAQLPALHTLFLRHYNMSDLEPSLQHIVNMKELRCLDILRSCNICAVPFSEFPGTLVKLRELHVTYDEDEEVFRKNVFDDLRHDMRHLRIFIQRELCGLIIF